MKIIYEIKNTSEFPHQFGTIAQKYGTEVLEHDEGPGLFIFVKSKIKISEKIRDNKKYVYVWGATTDDLVYLNSFWGEPYQVIELKMSPLDFASELIELPQIHQITKEDIIQTFGISERDFNQYSRFIKMASRKSDIQEEVKLANTILERL